MTLQADQFLLLDLIAAAVNGSHLKNHYFRDAILWYKDLSQSERFFLFHYSVRNHMESMTNEKYPHIGREDFMRFIARYDPRNQYHVTVDDGNGHHDTVQAYKFHNLYFITASSFCEPKFITEVIHDENVWPYYYEHYHHNYAHEVRPYLAELDKEINKEIEFKTL